MVPENTLPAFSGAIACRAHEIEFDLWLSRDGVPVVCHDPDLRRVAGADHFVMDTNWADIRALDTGKFHDPAWEGLKIPNFDEVLEVAAGRCIMNIHIKDPGPDNQLVKIVCDRIRELGLLDSAYIAGDAKVLAPALEYAPEVKRTCLDQQEKPDAQLESALKYKCFRAQLFTMVTEEQIAAFKKVGIQCSLFYADTVKDAQEWHRKGIDIILTNYAHTLRNFFDIETQ